MIADNCKAALAFEDAKDAKETLRALHVEFSIVFGCVYTSNNKLFATYYRDYATTEVHPSDFQKSGFSFGDGFLTVFRPIILDAEVIGTVCLRSDLHPMYVMLKRDITVIIAVISLSSLAAFVVSSRLQKVISVPILSLAESTTIIGKGDLNHRVQVQSKDELGYLAQSFNEMAEHLEKTTTSIDNLNREITEREKAEERLKAANLQLEANEEQLKQNINELERFNRLAVGRELRMVELKQQVNALLCELGREEEYRNVSEITEPCSDGNLHEK
jgi:methyl-accepting chemotaxis protein